ncbi:MAG: lysine exporter LysO family protein [Spirochaetales bacterium]|nr:lysine exporter LysO family protein [Spirochaetales bacterium]
MEALISLATLFIFLFAGMILARLPLIKNSPLIPKLSGVILYGLLFFMGFRMGRTTEGAVQLAEIGLISLAFALGTTTGTVIVLFLIFSFIENFKKKRAKQANKDQFTSESEKMIKDKSRRVKSQDIHEIFSHLKDPLSLFSFVAFGFILGLLLPFREFTGAAVSTWMLRLLLLSVGIDLTLSGVSFKAVLSHKETLILPVGTAIGSLLGGLCAGMFFSLAPARSLAVAAGFGWYSLSGVIITDLGNPMLGSAAFMSNILRETIALVTIPFAAASRFPNLAIGLGGATSMDVTLPLIERSCGPKAVPLAIASGAILSLLVPLLVPLFYQLS